LARCLEVNLTLHPIWLAKYVVVAEASVVADWGYFVNLVNEY
jgi:hypothetical protein